MTEDEKPEVEHKRLPLWVDGFTGQSYCDRRSVHGEWVHWPCEDAK